MSNPARRALATLMPGLAAGRRRLLQMTDDVTHLRQDVARVDRDLAAANAALVHAQATLDAIHETTRQHDDRLDVLRRLVSKVEHYQPLYGVAGIVEEPARESQERARLIAEALEPVRGRRVLDIGSSLGYMSFALADRGAHVVGWEYNADNAEVARQVAAINGLPVTFLVKELTVESVRTIPHGQVDAVLVLAVLHHVIHYQGLEAAQEIVRELLDRVPVLVVELATKGEDPDLFWDASQPEDPLEVLALVKDDVDVVPIAEVGTHLSTRTRPLLRISRRQSVTVGGRSFTFDSTAYEAYAGSPIANGPWRRRYFHGRDHIVKEYLFSQDTPDNWSQIIGELYTYSTLGYHSPIHHMIELVASDIDHRGARLALARVPGTLLSEVGRPDDQVLVTVVRDVLRTLADLRDHGFRHNDVRSWNIIVNDGGAWLIDYGRAAHAPLEDDVVALAWAVSSVARGTPEPATDLKQDLPDLSSLTGTPLEPWADALAQGERDPGTLLTTLPTAPEAS
ncbi:class I SAM-dependent methyltransferase [Cellulomonas xiejunii]|uniref:class I SAM-dependent methyltransferase n=1 Tax=Cellulomonas xiejunii TaxID=2968083 RepID=UPI001D0ECAE9|nr:class I SAM-dependent methyltransferase [Cellulomonas xiejunii]MCC2312930.1 methyltransferase domain-containing protein [Cellulomonas xiejunii]